MPADHGVVKLDFSNAFNSLFRDVILKPGRALLTSVMALMNSLSHGEFCSEITQILFGGQFIALEKKIMWNTPNIHGVYSVQNMEIIPDNFKFCHSSYNKPSKLSTAVTPNI